MSTTIATAPTSTPDSVGITSTAVPPGRWMAAAVPTAANTASPARP